MKQNLLLVGLLILFLNIIFWPKPKDKIEKRATLKEPFKVTVVGEVNRPKEFIFYNKVTVSELIDYCLGLTEDADYVNINYHLEIDSNYVLIINEKGKENDNLEEEIEKDIIFNLNTVTKNELMSIQGIGSSTADEIINYRKQNQFNSVEDLLNVKYIGIKTFEKIYKYFKV